MFARACYAMFAVAVLMAVLKLGGALGTEPLFLQTVPTEPASKTSAPAVGRQVSEGEVPEREAPDLRRAAEPLTSPIGRLLAGISSSSSEETPEVPVFYRPSSGDSGGPVCGDLGDFPRSSRVVFPVPEEYFNSYDDTWGAARSQGGHERSDLMSPAGTPEFAITDGTIVPIKRTNENGWNRLGGYTVMLKVAYDAGPIKEGDLFYYAHMDEASTLPIGTKVRAGQKIGTVGDTGEGPEVTRGKFPSHLHLGWYDGSGDRTALKSGAMNPYPLLLWVEQNGGAVSGGTNVSYCEAPQGPVPKPSTGESSWPASDSPDATPDLDTGDPNDPRPVFEEILHNHPPEREETARKDSPEKENKKVVKKRKVRKKASPKSTSEQRDWRRASPSARNENGSAREGGRASRPSGGQISPRPEPRRDEPQPFLTRTSKQSHASVLAAVIEGFKMTKGRDERDTPDEEKQKKPPDPTKNKSLKERRAAPDTRKTPEASEEKGKPEGREPEEKTPRPGLPASPRTGSNAP